MRDPLDLRPRPPRPCREGRDAGVLLLGWCLILGMGVPLGMGMLAVGSPRRFAALFGEPGHVRAVPSAAQAPGCPGGPCAPAPRP